MIASTVNTARSCTGCLRGVVFFRAVMAYLRRIQVAKSSDCLHYAHVRPSAISARQPGADRDWETFCAINARRRAIRDFDDAPVSDDEVCDVLEQALLAPSSGNLQPYHLHWIRDSATK